MSMLLGTGYSGSADLKRAVSHVHTRLKNILGDPGGILSRGVGWTLKKAPKRPKFRLNFGILRDLKVDLRFEIFHACKGVAAQLCVHVCTCHEFT